MSLPQPLHRGAALFATILLSSMCCAAPKPPPKPEAVALSLVYFAAVPTKPASDALPRVIDAPPIKLPPAMAARTKAGTWGTLVVQVDESGRVLEVSVAPSDSISSLVEPMREALMRWRFEPMRCSGVAAAVEIPLVLIARAGATDQLSEKEAAPSLAYQVVPATPDILGRREAIRSAADARYVPPSMQRMEVHQVGTYPGGAPRFVVVPSALGPQAGDLISTPAGKDEVVAWMKGSVTVDFVLDDAGFPSGAKIRSSNCSLLEPDAVAAVLVSRYRPAMSAGSPTRCAMQETIAFPVRGDLRTPAFLRRLKRPAQGDPKWDKPPSLVHLALPIYPPALAAEDVEGDAEVRIELDSTGAVGSVAVLSADRPEFGFALQAAALACGYAPATQAQKPVSSITRLGARFSKRPEQMPYDDPRLPAVILNSASAKDATETAHVDRKPRLLAGRQPVFRPDEVGQPSFVSVVLGITVEANGRVTEPTVISASRPEFGYATVQAAASWLFEPALMNGKPAAIRVRVPFGPMTESSAP